MTFDQVVVETKESFKRQELSGPQKGKPKTTQDDYLALFS